MDYDEVDYIWLKGLKMTFVVIWRYINSVEADGRFTFSLV